MIAIDILRWPGMNQAFIVSFVVTTGMALAVIPFGKRRKAGQPTTWGEAMVGAVYAFFVMFLAFGVVPHQFIIHGIYIGLMIYLFVWWQKRDEKAAAKELETSTYGRPLARKA
jgi:hypothetical protein